MAKILNMEEWAARCRRTPPCPHSLPTEAEICAFPARAVGQRYVPDALTATFATGIFGNPKTRKREALDKAYAGLQDFRLLCSDDPDLCAKYDQMLDALQAERNRLNLPGA